MAFYAVGAYLWGFFGSSSPSSFTRYQARRPRAPTSSWRRTGSTSFIFLGVIVAGIVGLVMGAAGAQGPRGLPRGHHLGCGEIIRQIANNLGQASQPHKRAAGHNPHTTAYIAQGIPRLLPIGLLEPLIGHEVTGNQSTTSCFYLIAVVVVVVVIVVTYGSKTPRSGAPGRPSRRTSSPRRPWGIRPTSSSSAPSLVGASFAGAMASSSRDRTFVSPESFTFLQSVRRPHDGHPGGIAAFPGVIIGAAVVTFLNLQVLAEFLPLPLASCGQRHA